jgi:hypothetical protein
MFQIFYIVFLAFATTSSALNSTGISDGTTGIFVPGGGAVSASGGSGGVVLVGGGGSGSGDPIPVTGGGSGIVVGSADGGSGSGSGSGSPIPVQGGGGGVVVGSGGGGSGSGNGSSFPVTGGGGGVVFGSGGGGSGDSGIRSCDGMPLGAMKCSGKGFSTCDSSGWVYRDCGAGTFCQMPRADAPLFCGMAGGTETRVTGGGIVVSGGDGVVVVSAGLRFFSLMFILPSMI